MGLSFSTIRRGVTIFTPSHLLGEGQRDFCPVVGGASGVTPSGPCGISGHWPGTGGPGPPLLPPQFLRECVWAPVSRGPGFVSQITGELPHRVH